MKPTISDTVNNKESVMPQGNILWSSLVKKEFGVDSEDILDWPVDKIINHHYDNSKLFYLIQ